MTSVNYLCCKFLWGIFLRVYLLWIPMINPTDRIPPPSPHGRRLLSCYKLPWIFSWVPIKDYAAHNGRNKEGNKKQRIRISTYQKLIIPQYMIFGRLKFFFPVPYFFHYTQLLRFCRSLYSVNNWRNRENIKAFLSNSGWSFLRVSKLSCH